MARPTPTTLRIGCAAGFWGDTNTAARQLVDSGEIDYLVFDYLSEITMSIMAAQQMRKPEAGFATDFVDPVLTPLLAEIKRQRIKVVSNAGGINPHACRGALQAAADARGIDLKIAVVDGDNLTARQAELRHLKDMEDGRDFPKMALSANAYLGALPIKTALDNGADIVITGRCVDSAIVLGPAMHEFGWAADDYDKLAQGSLAGHIIECGAQCTGGNFTDWDTVPDFDNMGFPIANISADASFTISKPKGTGGLVSTATVGEQMLYEIGDPRAYILPDVVCNFTQVTLQQAGDNLVRVQGATGTAPTDHYKVSVTYPDGFRATANFMVAGRNAVQKANTIAEAILKKTTRLFNELEWGDYRATDVEVIGSESTYGPHASVYAELAREVYVKIAVRHDNKEALKIFAREIAQAATGMAPGVTGYFGGRPAPTPIPVLFSCLVSKSSVPVSVDVAGEKIEVEIPTGQPVRPTLPAEIPTSISIMDPVDVPLSELAYARSGDKGNHANVGVIARCDDFVPFIENGLTPERVATFMGHVLDDPSANSVERWRLPGSSSFNVLLRNSLGGGGVASLKADPQGKCYGQMLLDMTVPVPSFLAREHLLITASAHTDQ